MPNMNISSSELGICSSHVKVAVRIRPLLKKELISTHSCCRVVCNKAVIIRKDGVSGGYLRSEQGSSNEYVFDLVFDENASQSEVYEKTVKQYISSILSGYNVTVFAYGATGAGKTHTMMGNTRQDVCETSTDAGIVPNALVDLFSAITDHKYQDCTEHWKVFITYVEVYNEQVYDLLEPSGRTLSLREDPERGIVVIGGISEKFVETPDEVVNWLCFGNKNRRTEATDANEVSSRSHAVLYVNLHRVRRNSAGRESVTETRLSLIDLAGSERASATHNRGIRLIEGASINKSLLALANCINALSENASVTISKRSNVKYRDSKLTHMLKSSLEGQCQVIMIANINPSHSTFEDSHNTLKYANRAKNIKLTPGTVSEVELEQSWHEREAALLAENKSLRLRVSELEKEVKWLRKGTESHQSCHETPETEQELDGPITTTDSTRSITHSIAQVSDVKEGMLPVPGRRNLTGGISLSKSSYTELNGKSSSFSLVQERVASASGGSSRSAAAGGGGAGGGGGGAGGAGGAAAAAAGGREQRQEYVSLQGQLRGRERGHTISAGAGVAPVLRSTSGRVAGSDSTRSRRASLSLSLSTSTPSSASNIPVYRAVQSSTGIGTDTGSRVPSPSAIARHASTPPPLPRPSQPRLQLNTSSSSLSSSMPTPTSASASTSPRATTGTQRKVKSLPYSSLAPLEVVVPAEPTSWISRRQTPTSSTSTSSQSNNGRPRFVF